MGLQSAVERGRSGSDLPGAVKGPIDSLRSTSSPPSELAELVRAARRFGKKDAVPSDEQAVKAHKVAQAALKDLWGKDQEAILASKWALGEVA